MARVEVLLPQWGMGMSEGTITTWLKGVGDTVAEDEPLAEVEAEKVEETLESPAAGTIVEIQVPEGETVEVRTPVAVIETRTARPRRTDRQIVPRTFQEELTMVRPELTGEPFDVIVVGAGINGVGIAQDAALRGLRVALLEQDDLCSGVSAWSGRLVHGGLRYLEQYDFGLVHESLSERERLFRLAPHLVKPVPLMVPIYKHNRRPPGGWSSWA